MVDEDKVDISRFMHVSKYIVLEDNTFMDICTTFTVLTLLYHSSLSTNNIPLVKVPLLAKKVYII